MDGFLCVNKPQGPSSFQIVSQIKRITGIRKIGHAGTLDPDASGLLVIATGYATRLLQYLPLEPKVYQFGLQFGSQTDTLDSKGSVLFTGGSLPAYNELTEVVSRYNGEYMQMPPAYSAKKINGVRAYKIARNGEIPQLQARPVKIYSLELIKYDEIKGCADMQVSCSGGTYVRSLVRDLASELSTYGFASYIHRVSSGDFSVYQAVDIDNIVNAVNYIIPSSEVFRKKDFIQLSELQMTKLVHGLDISLQDIGNTGSRPIFAYFETHLLAVLQCKQENIFHPVAVFPLVR